MWMLRRPSFMPAPWSCPCSAAQPPLATHVRKEQHVADRCGVGQQHDQAVDAQPLPAGGREAVFQRPDVVVVEVHRLVVASVAGLDLVAESGVAPTDRYSPRSSHIPVSDVRFDSRVISTSPPGRPPRSAPAPRRQRRQPQRLGRLRHPRGRPGRQRRPPARRRPLRPPRPGNAPPPRSMTSLPPRCRRDAPAIRLQASPEERRPLHPPRPGNVPPPGRPPTLHRPTSAPPENGWPGCAGGAVSPWPNSPHGSACRW